MASTMKAGGSLTLRSREILNADDRRTVRLQPEPDVELLGI
jgi:hypothetical protein